MYKRIKRGKHSGNCKGRFALLYKRRASGVEEEKKKKAASNKEKSRKRIERSDHRDNIKEEPEMKKI